MNRQGLVISWSLVMLISVLVPGASAVDPLWTYPAAPGGELSCVVISEDGSTIVAGGDQLIALSRNGIKLWTGWSGSPLVISREGNHILTSRGQTIRLISGSGTLLWDMSLGEYITDLAMMPDASLIAAAGGSRVRLINASGTGFRQNSSLPVNHIRFFPAGDRVVLTTKNGVQTSNFTLFSEWTDTNVTQDQLAVSANGSSFVTVTNNRIRFYSRDGNLLWNRAIPGGNALSFAYSRDGSTLVVGRDDNTVSVLDQSGTLIWTAGASHWITSVAVSDDGETIAAGSMDKSLVVYDRIGTKLGSSQVRNPIKANSVAMSSDGSVIAVVDESAVYGFSRSQFTQVLPAPAITTVSLSPVTTPPSAVTSPHLPPPASASPASTPRAALPVVVPAAALVFLIFCRSPFFYGDCVPFTKSSINLKQKFHSRSWGLRYASVPRSPHPHMRMVKHDGRPRTFEEKGVTGAPRMLPPPFGEERGQIHSYRRILIWLLEEKIRRLCTIHQKFDKPEIKLTLPLLGAPARLRPRRSGIPRLR